MSGAVRAGWCDTYVDGILTEALAIRLLGPTHALDGVGRSDAVSPFSAVGEAETPVCLPARPRWVRLGTEIA